VTDRKRCDKLLAVIDARLADMAKDTVDGETHRRDRAEIARGLRDMANAIEDHVYPAHVLRPAMLSFLQMQAAILRRVREDA
jgi:hypothetical protein